MLFVPKSTKFMKLQKDKVKSVSAKMLTLVYGTFALKVKQSCFITSKQLEMIKLNLSKGTKKVGRYWIRVFPHFQVTAKPLEVRMGKGKGYVDHWVSKVRRGAIICEVSGVSSRQASLCLKNISLKLPMPTMFISKTQC